MGIAYEHHEHVVTLTLDDGKVNAMAMPFFEELNAALDRAEADRPVGVVIAGRPGYFSAGLNLRVLPTLSPPEFERAMTAFGATMLRVYTFPVPTVAAITGHAIAGGAFLGFACDQRFVSDGPHKLHVNEVAIALPLPTWALVIAQSAIPARWQVEAILHARPYDPEEAFARDMVDGVVPPTDSVAAVAQRTAERFAGLDRGAYTAAKHRLRERDVAWARRNLVAEARGSGERAAV